MKQLALLILLIISVNVLAVTFVIDKPGVYNIGQRLDEIGIDLVEIATNDVTVDFNENFLTSGFNAVVVDDGLSNIIIRNGFINSIIDTGIVIGENCRNVQIIDMNFFSCGRNAIRFGTNFIGGVLEKLTISGIGKSAISIPENCSSMRFKDFNIASCGGSAIELLGTATNLVRDMLFEDVVTSSCVLSPTFTQVFNIQHGLNIVFNNSAVGNAGNAFGPVDLFKFTDCNQCIIQGALCVDNVSRDLIGVHLLRTHSSVITQVSLGSSIAITGDLTGFLLTDSSDTNFLSQNIVLSCSAENGDARGYYMKDLSNANLFRNCQVAALIGQNVIAFDMQGTETLFCNVFEGCDVGRCLASTGSFIGCNIDGAEQGAIIDSKISFNSGSSFAAGLLFAEGSGGNCWHIRSNNFVQNLAQDDADSYGILVQTGTRNLFIQNVAFKNGSILDNQLNGVPAGSQTQIDTENVNAITAPWTNIAAVA